MSVFELLSIFACGCTGLYAGSMLTEAGLLVPHWRKMDPDEFLQLHHTMAPSLFRFYAPLTVLGTLSAPLVLIIGLISGADFGFAWWIAALLSLAVLAVYFGYFQKANKSFETGESGAQAAKTLATWAVWHNARTIGSIAAFIACIVALAGGGVAGMVG